MFLIPPILIVPLSALVSYIVLRSFIPLLRLGFLDEPNSRSSHTLPVPRGGGVVFVGFSFLASLISFIGGYDYISAIPLFALPIAFIGFIDDHINLSASLRFSVHIFTALLLLSFSPLCRALLSSLDLNILVLVFLFLLLLIFVSSIVNFTNFMDGLDGMVAGCMSVSIFVLSLNHQSSWPIWILIGSLIGFLILNWSPASVFMGDVGSTFLGAVFAGLVLHSSNWSQVLVSLLLATPLLADAFFCVPRRLLAGQPVFKAHRLHLFQRLHQAGWSHAAVSSLYVAATLLLAFAKFTGGLPLLSGCVVAELLFGLWLDQRVAVPFAVASKS